MEVAGGGATLFVTLITLPLPSGAVPRFWARGIWLRVLGAGVDPKFGECDRIEAADSVHRANQADWEGLRPHR
jgi:hypothetical protein